MVGDHGTINCITLFTLHILCLVVRTYEEVLVFINVSINPDQIFK